MPISTWIITCDSSGSKYPSGTRYCESDGPGLKKNLSSGWAGIFSLTLVSVKLLLKTGLGILDR